MIGGDFLAPHTPLDNFAVTNDGGRTWQLKKTVKPVGLKQCVAYVPGSRMLIATGESGTGYSADEGESWEPLTNGLPQENAYEVILRDAVTSAGNEVYFGTKNGKLFGSTDNGDSWEMIQGSLPEINCVRAY